MRDYLDELLAEQEQDGGREETGAAETAAGLTAGRIGGVRNGRAGEAEEAPWTAEAGAHTEAFREPEPYVRTEEPAEVLKSGTGARPAAGPERARRDGGETAVSPGARAADARHWAEAFYGQVRRTAEAAGYRGKSGTDAAAIPTRTERSGPGPEELDRAFQRDARRYDGGFELY